MRANFSIRRWVLLGALMLAMPALAQRGGVPGSGGPGRGSMPGGVPGGLPSGSTSNQPGLPNRGGPPPGNAPDARSTTSTMRGGLQIGPPGRWWDDKHFARDLNLRSEQQRRMDSIFEGNRASLLRSFQTLEVEQSRMETLTHAKNLDEAALFAQIDRVAQARAELEKANTHLLLQIRGEMDGDQIERLEQHR